MINFEVNYHNVDVHKISKELKKVEETTTKYNKIFTSLPSLNIINEVDDINEIKLMSEEISKNKDQFIVLGTGGSNLGAMALINILNQSKSKKIKFYDNIDPIKFMNSIEQFDIEKLGIIIISKSGATLETLSQFSSIVEIFQNKKNAKDLLEECLVITENKESPLQQISNYYNCKILYHHPDIGGRYSVFSNVGLLPASIAGLDIAKIRDGAKNLISQVKNGSFREHLISAQLMLSLQNLKKINLSVLMTYSDALYYFGKWYLQLWAESIGKNNIGITPIHAVGTTDQHSQLQLYLDGPKDKFFTFITTSHSKHGLKINKKIFEDHNIKYLAGKFMGDLMQAEQQATIDTFNQSGFAFREITLPIIDEFSIGQIMILSMIETISTCFFLGIDPFNQPAVERGKKLTKQYLS